ncbi:four helix bundle protein [Agriterribacter sp.]|uniref:four helix bundle protein n=1 Tax=Agriterribacter sp. TaxID=2821509 RepID=UPI002C5DC86E|nr:four helix bundle protein [Agriterribacter sp.]HTN07178.1 four helix bundle protein [Agriterribacter sp.]
MNRHNIRCKCKTIILQIFLHLISRAALSIHLNIAEGASKKSKVERRRYYEISRGSIVEVDAALDIASDLNYLNNIDMKDLAEKMVSTFKLLTGLILSCSKH